MYTHESMYGRLKYAACESTTFEEKKEGMARLSTLLSCECQYTILFLSKYALRWITTRREDEGGRDFFLFCGEAKLASFSFHFTKSVDLLREIHYCVKLFRKKTFLLGEEAKIVSVFILR